MYGDRLALDRTARSCALLVTASESFGVRQGLEEPLGFCPYTDWALF